MSITLTDDQRIKYKKLYCYQGPSYANRYTIDPLKAEQLGLFRESVMKDPNQEIKCGSPIILKYNYYFNDIQLDVNNWNDACEWHFQHIQGEIVS